MSGRYHQGRVATRWQDAWEDADVYAFDETADTIEYILGMFPYTSGEIHMGHVRNYSITDAYARFRRMQGAAVLHPMGWDSFGLPAENAAHDREIDPRSWTVDCIDRMRAELRGLGLGYDWSREITTCEPEYYRWNQWLFRQLYEADLVEYTEATVNWCPDCETVLADAQVETSDSVGDRPASPGSGRDVADGICWRCDTPVAARSLPQWFFRITEYAEDLANGLDELSGWPSGVREIQRHWIGRQEGAEIRFDLSNGDDVTVFSARVDTIFGATYLAVAPTHPIAEELDEDLVVTVDRWWGTKTDLTATHPLTGEPLPVYIAGYVLADVGTGAVMGVPAHDERDYEFATTHELPIKQVIETAGTDDEVPITADGTLIQSESYTSLASAEARESLLDESAIDTAVTYRLRDWLISRQRYWGTPIPIVHCPECGPVLVPEDELPIELPPFQAVRGNPLDAAADFIETTCPECGHDASRETDTMDTFVDSSWYFLRFLSPDYADGPFDPEIAADILPVDLYVGGEEHAVLHLLYLRFIARALADLDLLSVTEPIERLLTQGTVLHSGQKMSKSVGNVVSPHEYGAETTRLFVLSAAHPNRDFEWTAADVTRAYDLQQDIYDLVVSFGPETGTREESDAKDRYVERELDRTIEATTREYESFRFHRAINEIESLVSLLARYRRYAEPNRYTYQRGLRILAALTAPVAPFLAEEVWDHLGGRGLMAAADWPRPLRPRPDYARERSLVDRVRNDVREIIAVAGIADPSHIELTVAATWKYEAHECAREATDADEFRSIANEQEWFGESDEKNAYLGSLAGRLAQLEPVLPADREAAILERASWLLDDEFDVTVDIIREDELDTIESEAAPGRPGITIS